MIDLEWLFDSLIISQVQFGVEPEEIGYFTCVDKKGLSVIEDFVNAYVELYENVYLHKTTRGIQILFQEALRQAFVVPEVLARLPAENPIVAYFSAETPSLSQYLKLDEPLVISLVHHIAEAKLGISSILAKRFLNREVLKCYEVSLSDAEPNHGKIAGLIKFLRQKGIWHQRDTPRVKGYKHFDVVSQDYVKNIFVRLSQNDFRTLGAMRPHIVKTSGSRVRFYFLDEASRAEARRFIESQ